MNWVGLAAATAAFLGIWCGHAAVRKIEFVAPTIWLPTLIFAVAGIVVDWLSVSVASQPLSAFLGIFGITLLWDALEFTRQQKRIQKGHAPANPHILRHAKILTGHPTATTIDLLKRVPATIHDS
jgi:hypothetical protein